MAFEQQSSNQLREKIISRIMTERHVSQQEAEKLLTKIPQDDWQKVAGGKANLSTYLPGSQFKDPMKQ